jgi:TRAP-type C4-dicarboxylate transport system substrate-binding protein
VKYTKLFFKRFVLAIFAISCIINTSWAENSKIVLKFATLGQKGISIMAYLDEVFFPELTKATEGQILFDVYWGGVMGDEEDYIGKMRTGQLQGAMVTASGGITAAVCPDLSVLELPFLFKAWAFDEVDYVTDKIRAHLFKEAEKRGYKILLITAGDFDQIYSTKHNIETIEDIKKAKILTWFGPLENRMLNSLGISPIPVNVPEVVSSIKSGIANMAISPSMWWVGAQLYPDTKYVNPLPIRYVPGLGVLTLDTWENVPDKYKKILYGLLIKNEKKFKKVMRDCNEKSYKAMIKYGIKEVKVTPDELARFKKATRSVWDELAGKSYSREILDEVIGLLAEYRNKKNKSYAE